jgi:hypothetical protein
MNHYFCTALTGWLMLKKIIQFIFFGNYFLGLLLIALSLETVFQLRLPLNSPAYYLLMFSVVIVYYTYAYSGGSGKPDHSNARSNWYYSNRSFVLVSQLVLSTVAVVMAIWLIISNVNALPDLPFYYWFIVALVIVTALLYYGLMPGLFFHINLRDTGWLKAFVIGFLWACCANLLPVLALKVERNVSIMEPGLLFWGFIKNWMFCSVNAIMFDIKDYADDSNRKLKTVVVRLGLHKTIFYVLFPLLTVGALWVVTVTRFYHFRLPAVLLNLVPFICFLFASYSLHKHKSILYYLVVIDGILLIKACCGIAGSFVAR